MRGDDKHQAGVFVYVLAEERIPQDHPLREIKRIMDKALKKMHPLFSKSYSKMGRRSIPPEHLLRGLLLQALYTIRSERQLIELYQVIKQQWAKLINSYYNLPLLRPTARIYG
jgi:transposase